MQWRSKKLNWLKQIGEGAKTGKDILLKKLSVELTAVIGLVRIAV
jgi:hypothetical protein